MVIIIDAYNFLKQKFLGQFINENQRRNFINRLRAYAKQKQHSIEIVFDGGEYYWPTRKKEDHITVTYSGNRSADDIIKEVIPSLDPQNSLIISSDHEICNLARDNNVFSMDPFEFDNFVEITISTKKFEKNNLEKDKNMLKNRSKNNQLIRYEDTNSPVLDELMENSTDIMLKKEEDDLVEKQNRIKPRHHVSREEKKIMSIIKKL